MATARFVTRSHSHPHLSVFDNRRSVFVANGFYIRLRVTARKETFGAGDNRFSALLNSASNENLRLTEQFFASELRKEVGTHTLFNEFTARFCHDKHIGVVAFYVQSATVRIEVKYQRVAFTQGGIQVDVRVYVGYVYRNGIPADKERRVSYRRSYGKTDVCFFDIVHFDFVHTVGEEFAQKSTDFSARCGRNGIFS